ncbi:TRAP transporter substrate-binding protein [Propionivibrio sp.]|uniref:TRAP transporter substrate-binding protein n=1 Tax=Propionivibrio sp. TaxID=2212460 RepID=UPI0039E5B21D
MNASVSALLCCLVLPVFMVGSIAANGAEIRERTFRFSHVQPKESHFEAGVQKFAELVSQKSNKKITIKSFPAAMLGGDMQTVQALRSGTIDMTVLPPGLLVGLSKEFAVFDLPFLFNNFQEADELLDGKVGQKLMEKAPPGLVGLVYWDHGFRNVSNSKRPIARLEDFQGLKIRVSQSPMIIESIGGLGSNPLPMPFTEVYTSLETKAVDGQENPTAVFESNKFYEVQKYLSLTRHQYNPLIVLVSKKIWDQLNDDERKLLREAADETRNYQRQVSRDMEKKALELVKAKGAIVNDVPPQEVERMRAKLTAVSEKLAREQIGEAIVKEVYAELERIRATSK